MSVFIGSTTPSQRVCLSKEFKKLYAKKKFIPRKQKIAIALNTCDVGIKGVKKAENLLSAANKRKIISDYREFISNGFPKSEAKKFALRNYTYLTYGLDKAEAELEKLIKKNKDLIESSRSYVPDSQFKV
jgi:hypothetical protein